MSETIMYEDVADYLVTLALAIKNPSNVRNVFGGTMPPLPNFAIAIYEHTGFRPIRAMGSRRMDVLTLQIIVRDIDSTVARARAYAIYTALDVDFNLLSPAARIINGVQYYAILAKHAPFMMGQDENKRFRWTCSFEVTRD
jgi:hypothetical protein